MPANQPPSASNSQPPPSNLNKSSTLVRSKSLRLSSSRPKLDSGTSTLTRHGSIRVPKTQSTTAPNKPLFSVIRKPAVKPKPSFYNSRSNENLDSTSTKPKPNAEIDKRMTTSACFSPTKHSDERSAGLTDTHRTPSDSPTSLYSDKSHSQEANSWCNSDLVSHLRRLTEEHEKLQVEHARLRMQLLKNLPVTNLRKDQQHLSQSDSHLASIPENSPDGSASLPENDPSQAQEAIIQNYHSEVLRLQEENRKLQRKYWEQVLNSELVEDESCNGASQQIVDLIDKLDNKEKDLLEASGRVQELENHLAATNLELQQSQDALQDQQHRLEEALIHREELLKQLKEHRRALSEARENMDFLQIERSTLAETFQETEQSLHATKAELLRAQSKANELMDHTRKMYLKIKDKDLQVQLLRAELDRTQGNCRDMLLSQGAELTMISMHLSQLSMTVHSILTAAADFAASELSLQKEMLEEVMAECDSESERNESPKDNIFQKSDSQIPNSAESAFSNDKFLDTHKSLPDIFACEPISPLYSSASSESERPMSLVQSRVQSFEQSAKSESKSSKQVAVKPASEQNSDSVKSSIENLSSINGDLSRISSPSKDSSPVANSAFKPIGMATAFRPVRQRSLESDAPFVESSGLEDEKRTSFDTLLSEMDKLVKKVGKVIELTQEKFVAKVRLLNEEKSNLQEELYSSKKKQYELQADLNNRDYLVEKANGQVEELLMQIKKSQEEFAEEKEALIHKNLSLTEQIKCLEAVNAEQSNQITNEVQKMVDTAASSDPNHEFASNAQDICDKLNLKQEIAKLKAMLAQKEAVLQQLAQKYTRTTSKFQSNLKKAEKEIQVLDNVIEKVFTTLESNSELVEKNEVLKNLLSLVSGNCTLSNVNSKEEKTVTKL